MPKSFLYRRGDGNEGNFVRALITLADNENPYAALRALVASDYIANTRTRRHIVANIEIDGEADFGISAVIYEGPQGEMAFGAAWLTAELEPLSADDVAYHRDSALYAPDTLRSALDLGAWKLYRKHAKED